MAYGLNILIAVPAKSIGATNRGRRPSGLHRPSHGRQLGSFQCLRRDDSGPPRRAALTTRRDSAVGSLRSNANVAGRHLLDMANDPPTEEQYAEWRRRCKVWPVDTMQSSFVDTRLEV